jgi:hypothetical protein
MTTRLLLGCALAGVIVGGAGATPAAAEEAHPPPPQDTQPACLQESSPVEPCLPCSEPQAPPATHHGLLLMGYLGVNAFPGKGVLDNEGSGINVSVGPGLRLGGLAGFYVTPQLSMSGELTVDLVNTDDSGGYWTTGGTRTVLALSPLLHVPASRGGTVEIAIGPKLGMRWMSISSQSSEVFSAKGYLAGVNAGVFARGGDVMLGGLLSFEVSKASEACRQPDVTVCAIDVSGVSAEKVVSISGATLF